MSSKPTSPVPPTGLPPGVATGSLGKRLAAQILDGIVPVGAALVFFGLLRTGDPGSSRGFAIVGLALIAGWLLLVWSMVANNAASPGMRALGLQLVGLRDGRPIGWVRYLIRSLVLAALTVTVVGLVLMLVLLIRHPRKQGWHDLVADSVVIRERPLAPRRSLSSRGSAQAPTSSAPRPSRSADIPPTTNLEAVAPGVEVPEARISQVKAPQGKVPDAKVPDAKVQEVKVPDAKVPEAKVPEARTPGAEESVRLTRPARTSNSAFASPERGRADRQDDRPLTEGWFVVLDDGREVPVRGLVLLGRNPQPRPGEDDAELIKVADDTRTVSKTHLSINVDANGLFVTDRGSTNGTTLTTTPGSSRPCSAGKAVPVSSGFVSFGDHWLRIERRREGEGREG